MDLAGLIYSKSYGHEVQQRLLKISRSSMWAEDLIDYVGELVEDREDAEKEMKTIKNKMNDKEDFEDLFNKFKEEIRDVIFQIIKTNALNFNLLEGILDIPQDELITKLRQLIDDIIEKKIIRTTAKIGGIECSVDH